MTPEEKQRIEKEAAKFARFNYNHDVVEGAEYRGYIAGATAEHERMYKDDLPDFELPYDENDPKAVDDYLRSQGEDPEKLAATGIVFVRTVIENIKLKEQLKEERNKAIELQDEVKKYVFWHDKFFNDVKVGQPPSLQPLRNLIKKFE